MSKARTLANLISDNAELADGQISVAEVVGAAPTANPTFTGNLTVDTDTLYVDSSSDEVGINTSAPGGALDVRTSNNGRLLVDLWGSQKQYYNDDIVSELNWTGSGDSWFKQYTNISNVNSLYNSLSSSGAVFNEDGADRDFRVETNNSTHALFIVGSTDRIGINNGNPNYDFEVGNQNASVSRTISIAAAGDSEKRLVFRRSTSEDWIFKEDTAENFSIDGLSGKELVINQAGADVDFRIESNDRTDAFFVNGLTNCVGIRTTGPVLPLSLGSRTGANLNYINGTSNLISTDTGIFVSASTTDDTDTSFGLQLANNANSVGARSPMITFSALSASDSYQHVYATINGVKTGNGADTNWNVGGIDFSTSSGTGPHIRMSLDTVGGLNLKPQDNGNFVWNENAQNSDFRVESFNSSHALFVNAGSDSVVINGDTGRASAPLTAWGGSSAVLSLVRNNLSGGSTSGTTGLWMGDAGSGVVTLAREKTNINTADTVIYGEHGYNTQEERMRLSRGYINLRTDGATRVQITSVGIKSPTIYNNNSGGSANLGIASSGEFYRSTSSLKYKTEVQDAEHGLSEVLSLRPVTYKGLNDGDKVFGGLIAEEVHDAGLSEFVEYDDNGEPDALAYANMVSLCIKAIQEQQATIETLEARIAALENS